MVPVVDWAPVEPKVCMTRVEARIKSLLKRTRGDDGFHLRNAIIVVVKVLL